MSAHDAETFLKWRVAKEIGGGFFLRTEAVQGSILTFEIWGILSGEIPRFIDDVQIDLTTYKIIKDFSREKMAEFRTARYLVGTRRELIYDQQIVDLFDDLCARDLFTAPDLIREIRSKYLYSAVNNTVTRQEWWLYSKYRNKVDPVSIMKSDLLKQYSDEQTLELTEEQTIVVLARGICVLREKPLSSTILSNAMEGYETVMTELYKTYNVQSDEFNRDTFKLNKDIVDVLHTRNIFEKTPHRVVYALIARTGRALISDKYRIYFSRYMD